MTVTRPRALGRRGLRVSPVGKRHGLRVGSINGSTEGITSGDARAVAGVLGWRSDGTMRRDRSAWAALRAGGPCLLSDVRAEGVGMSAATDVRVQHARF
jgi:hypothetical protein